MSPKRGKSQKGRKRRVPATHETGALTLPGEVRERERKYVTTRRLAAKLAASEEDAKKLPLIGLALSGGGIRSATFCLGVLQLLAKEKLLRFVDYMSTVSGGGYIGSCLTSLMTLPRKKSAHASWNWNEKQAFDMDHRMPLLKKQQIHHLRKHGDFLILRRGVFRREVLRTIGTMTLGLVCTVGAFLSVVALAVAGLFLYGYLFGAAPDRTSIWEQLHSSESHAIWKDAVLSVWPGSEALWWVLAGSACALLALILSGIVSWLYGRPETSSGETPEDTMERLVLLRAVLFLVLVVEVLLVGCFVYPGTFGGDLIAARPRGLGYPNLLIPALVFVGALAATWVVYLLNALIGSPKTWHGRVRTVLGAMQGFCVYALLASVGIVAIIFAAWWLRISAGLEWLPRIIGIAALAAARMLAKREGDAAQDKTGLAKITAMAPDVLMALAVPALIVCALLVGLQIVLAQTNYAAWPIHLLWIGGAALLVFGLFVDYNRISPHVFYNDRLTETYLQTEAADGGLRTVRSDGQIEIRELHDRFFDAQTHDNPAPYHLIECALNLPGSRDLARRNRKSDHFIFSREFCGSGTTGYVHSEYYRGGETKLSDAMTISGAAVASSMGFATSFTRAFALTLFNIRLGQWLVNPRIYDDEKPAGQRIVFYPKTARPPTHWSNAPSSCPICRRALGRYVKFFKERFVFWPAYLFREMAAGTNARGALVNLSDGGHTGDNIGLYPLLQRRCKLIIACDAECDPDYSFRSLTAAIGQILTDENVKVSIDLDQIRPEEEAERPQSHYVIGRIEYPECGEPFLDDPDRNYKVGWLVYLKSSFCKVSEPVTVKSYAAKHPEFPHQPTTDQFFDDDQFEAYRSLGTHIARTLLSDARLLSDRKKTADQLITWCKRSWKPTRAQMVEAWQKYKGNEEDIAAWLYSEPTKKDVRRVRALLLGYGMEPKGGGPAK